MISLGPTVGGKASFGWWFQVACLPNALGSFPNVDDEAPLAFGLYKFLS